jgi:hypothetical protein
MARKDIKIYRINAVDLTCTCCIRDKEIFSAFWQRLVAAVSAAIRALPQIVNIIILIINIISGTTGLFEPLPPLLWRLSKSLLRGRPCRS